MVTSLRHFFWPQMAAQVVIVPQVVSLGGMAGVMPYFSGSAGLIEGFSGEVGLEPLLRGTGGLQTLLDGEVGLDRYNV
jgi:hypothetical protein